MNPDFFQAALVEFYRLEARLRPNPDFQRYEALRRAIALYAPEGQPLMPLDPVAPTPPGTTTATPTVASEENASLANSAPTIPVSSASSRRGRYTWTTSQLSRIRDAAAEHLKQVGKRQTGGQIYKAILSAGVEVQGKKPAAVVCAALTSSPRFDHIRREGYGLAEWSNANGKW